jgi:D-3-phosphoglycerate dehydrogenase / 2-oxoglutarate reductase
MSRGEARDLTGIVLLTDHPWPGTSIERQLLNDAGLDLREAPPGATDAELTRLASGVVGILTCWAPVSAPTIAAAGDQLRVVARFGIGIDNIDLPAAYAAGATVTYVPGYCAEEVSDHVLALVLCWARQVPWYRDRTRAGAWSPLAFATRRVSDLVVGVFGRGSMGLRTAEKFRALGCEVVVRGRPTSADPEAELCEFVSGLDVLTLHVPLRNDTMGLISGPVLAAMRPGSLLVNTSRGPLVDSQVLLRALCHGRPGFAALDVLDTEPAVGDELRHHSSVILTPHVAFSSDRSIEDVRHRACQDLLRVLRGVPPLNPVPTGR